MVSSLVMEEEMVCILWLLEFCYNCSWSCLIYMLMYLEELRAGNGLRQGWEVGKCSMVSHCKCEQTDCTWPSGWSAIRLDQFLHVQLVACRQLEGQSGFYCNVSNDKFLLCSLRSHGNWPAVSAQRSIRNRFDAWKYSDYDVHCLNIKTLLLKHVVTCRKQLA